MSTTTGTKVKTQSDSDALKHPTLYLQLNPNEELLKQIGIVKDIIYETKDSTLVGMLSVVDDNGYCSVSELFKSLNKQELQRVLYWFQSSREDHQHKFGYFVTVLTLAEGFIWTSPEELHLYMQRTLWLVAAELHIRNHLEETPDDSRLQKAYLTFHKHLSLIDYDPTKLKL